MPQQQQVQASTAVVGAAVGGAAALASVSMATRLLSFLLNVVLTRFMADPAVLGVASIQLQLLYISTLTIVREGVRRASLRLPAVGTTAGPTVSSLVNAAWIAFAAGTVLTPAACWLYLQRETDGHTRSDDYEASVRIVGLAILVELMSEPWFVVAQSRLLYGLRSRIEGLAVLARCVTTFALAVGWNQRVAAFAGGYLAYSAFLLLAYVVCFALSRDRDEADFLPRLGAMLPSRWLEVDPALRRLALGFSRQTVWKLLLAEGEKFVMVLLGSRLGFGAADQGVYAVVSNLGSLVARFMLQPVEEAAFAVFGKLNEARQSGGSASSAASSPEQPRLSIEGLLSTVVRATTLLGLLIASFGPAYSHLLLRLLYGTTWADSEAPAALAWYCTYVLLLALNGVTEAFVHAVADRAALERLNRLLVACSVFYLCCSALVLGLGVRGMIAANCANMGFRIAFSARFIRQWSPASARPSDGGGPGVQVAALLLHRYVLCAFALSVATTLASERLLYEQGEPACDAGLFSAACLVWVGAHVGVGVALLCASAEGIVVTFSLY